MNRQLALDIAETVRSVCIDEADESREVLEQISTSAIVDSLLGDARPPVGYAIRCSSVETLYNGIRNPFTLGSWMKEYLGARGKSLENAPGFSEATIFSSREDAMRLIAHCSGYCATFEVVEIYAD